MVEGERELSSLKLRHPVLGRMPHAPEDLCMDRRHLGGSESLPTKRPKILRVISGAEESVESRDRMPGRTSTTGSHSLAVESRPVSDPRLEVPSSELQVLGAMLINEEAVEKARGSLRPESFNSRAHRVIFRALCRIHQKGAPVDLVTLSQDLKERGELEEAGGLAYLIELVDATPTATGIEWHARRVREQAALRKILSGPGPETTADFLEEVRIELQDLEAAVWTTRFRFLTDSEIEARIMPPFLIEGLIREGSLAVLFGPPGVGKSLLALDWGLCIELGIPWNGGLQVMMGHVVYVIAEGAGTLGPRVLAWKDHHSVAGPSGLHFVTEPVPLMDSQAVSAFLRDLRASMDELPVLVVFDTLARCMVGGDENSAKEMGLLVEGADRIRRELGCACLLVHHPNKGLEIERGSIALRAAVDTMMSLKAVGAGAVRLSWEKQKDGEEFGPIEMTLTPHRDSVVLTANSPVAVGTGALSPTVRETLAPLSSHSSPEGLSAKEWAAACEKRDSTFFRHLRRFKKGGYVNREGRGKGALYTLSEKGREILS